MQTKTFRCTKNNVNVITFLFNYINIGSDMTLASYRRYKIDMYYFGFREKPKIMQTMDSFDFLIF